VVEGIEQEEFEKLLEGVSMGVSLSTEDRVKTVKESRSGRWRRLESSRVLSLEGYGSPLGR